MNPPRPRRVPFTVRPEANKVFGCERCRRRLLTGEKAVTLVYPGMVVYRHAGRTCPPVYAYRPTP